jgi:hypothetical protein
MRKLNFLELRKPEVGLPRITLPGNSVNSSLRRRKACIRGRIRLQHLHDSSQSQGAEGKKGLRQGPQKPRQEHHLDRFDHSRRSYGHLHDCVEGATDAEAFEAYVEHCLAPSLCEGQVVVLDGLGAHRTQRVVTELIEARGADLLFLPSYSPGI